MRSNHLFCFVCFVFFVAVSGPTQAQKTETKKPVKKSVEKEEISKTIRKAVEFYRKNVSTEGGYLWKYSSDLTLREGENVADARTVWVQPPGTPTIGQIFLKAYRITGDRYYLEAASDVGHCLVRGQLHSGGWAYAIYFDPEKRKTQRYRIEPVDRSVPKTANASTLDDNTTQSALVFLMELDAALDFKDGVIGEAVQYALDRLLAAQYPNGAFPQRYYAKEKFDLEKFPIKAANFPPKGTEPTHEKDYSRFYTFNDNLARDVSRVFFVAAEIYGTKNDDGTLRLNQQYVDAAKRLGDFIILAQMPEPQPAWAQQYDFQMRPCWARKFEPAAVSGGESQILINTLIDLYTFLGDKKYLEPIPKAIAYLERSQRPDGKLARFYEMETNKPLYMTKDYQLTYSDEDTPDHYVFTVSLKKFPIDEYRNIDEKTRLQKLASLRKQYRNLSVPQTSEKNLLDVVRSLNDHGAWLSEGKLKSDSSGQRRKILDNIVFVRNTDILLGALQ